MDLKIYGYWHCADVDHRPVEVGCLVAWDFKPWRVVSFRKDEERREADEEHYDYWYVVLRPAGEDMTWTASSKDVHLRGSVWPRSKDPLRGSFDRLHEHYGLCVHCGELLPCRDRMAERAAERAAARDKCYESAGVCPHCQEAVTHRQESETFPNAYVPLGPPVTFHAGRRACRYAMEKYRELVGQPESQLRLDGGAP